MNPRSQAQTRARQPRSCFLALVLRQLLLVAPDSAHVDHQSRADQDLRDSNLTTNGQLASLSAKRMRHTANRALDRRSPVVAFATRSGSPLTQQRHLHLTQADIQRSPIPTLHRACRASIGERARLATSLVKVGHEAIFFASSLDFRFLFPRTSHGHRYSIGVYLPSERLQAQPVRRCSSTTKVRRDMLNLLLSQGVFCIGAGVATIRPQRIQLRSLLQLPFAPSARAALPPEAAHHRSYSEPPGPS